MRRRLLGLLLMWLVAATAAWGTPVPQGSLPTGVIITPGPNGTTTIVQGVDRAAINWSTFDIGRGEVVIFRQPGATSATLNTVLGGSPSIILGRLQANGQIFLINRNGFFFGKDSLVDVGSLLVSTLSVVRTEDFLAGRYPLRLEQSGAGAVAILQGQISVQPGGYVVVAAPLVDNEGSVVAAGGRISVSATRQLVLLDAKGAVQIDPLSPRSFGDVVVPPAITANADWISNYLAAAVKNTLLVPAGEIRTGPNGSVTLVASEGLLVGGGTLKTDGFRQPTGNIDLLSTQGTLLTDDVVLSATSTSGAGGRISILSQGNNVLETGYSIRAGGAPEGTVIVSPAGTVVGDLTQEVEPPGPESAGPEGEVENASLESAESGFAGTEARGVEGYAQARSDRTASAQGSEVVGIGDAPAASRQTLTVSGEGAVRTARIGAAQPTGTSARAPQRLIQRQIVGTQTTIREDRRSLMRRLYSAHRKAASAGRTAPAPDLP